MAVEHRGELLSKSYLHTVLGSIYLSRPKHLAE